MSNKASTKDDSDILSLVLCYNCKTEIIDKSQKCCPNCNIILNPNSYINWRNSWYGFLCILCLTPLIIALLFYSLYCLSLLIHRISKYFS